MLLGYSSYGQESVVEENKTIYINDKKNVVVFFDDYIDIAQLPYKYYAVAYEGGATSKVCILRASKSSTLESNLLVYTKNGNIYNLTVKYKKNIKKNNYIIKSSEAIGNQNGEIVTKKQKKRKRSSENLESDEDFEITKEDSLQKSKRKEIKLNSESFIEKKPYFKHLSSTNEDVTLKLNDVIYNKDELYFLFEIKNNSTLDYDINYKTYHIVSRKKSKRSSSQKLTFSEEDILYEYQIPERIKAFESSKYIVVFNKFSIDSKKHFLVELNELNGERNIKLYLNNDLVNNPNLN